MSIIHPIPEPPFDPDDTEPITPPDAVLQMAFERVPESELEELAKRLTAVEHACAAFECNGIYFDWRAALRHTRDLVAQELTFRGPRPEFIDFSDRKHNNNPY